MDHLLYSYLCSRSVEAEWCELRSLFPSSGRKSELQLRERLRVALCDFFLFSFFWYFKPIEYHSIMAAYDNINLKSILKKRILFTIP